MKRRTVLGGLGVVLAAQRGVLPASAASSDTPLIPSAGRSLSDRQAAYKILVGGLPGGLTDRWARTVALAAQDVLSPHTPVRVQTIGGRDGVTGANRLQGMVASDGRVSGMLPGEMAIAFLTGDPRVHFQPSEWVPVLAGVNPSIIVLRGGLARLSQPAPIRLAATGPESVDLAAILAFDKLGVATAPIFGLRGAAAARAFSLDQADAVMLTGAQISANAARLRNEGGVEICSFGVVDERAHAVRDPQFANLPTVEELAASRGATPLPLPLDQAYRAVVTASRIAFILVLPHLTPPAAVALWRQAALSMLRAPAIRSATATSGISVTEAGATAAIALLSASTDAVLALRRMLFKRFGWRPS